MRGHGKIWMHLARPKANDLKAKVLTEERAHSGDLRALENPKEKARTKGIKGHRKDLRD